MLDLELIENLAKLSLTEFATLFDQTQNDDEALELLKHRCATDLKLFARTYFPHYCNREFSPFHEEICRRFKFRERNIRSAIAAPRGNAKSTWRSLIVPIHDVCYGSEKFILVLSSTTPLANKKLKDIRQEISDSAELRAAYGVRFPKKKVGESEFLAISENGRTYFAAVGRGSEVRGIRIGENRPTKIISDDVEFSEEVYNERSRKKTEDWYFEDVTKAGDEGTNIELVGTILHRDSLLSKLLKNPRYEGSKYQAVIAWSEREDLWNKWREFYRNLDNPNRLADAMAFYDANKVEMLKGTKVLWPEKEDYLAHMIDMEEIGRRAFMKEKQNDPQGTDEPIFERMHWYREVPEGFKIEASGVIVPWRDLQCVGAMDPSTGQVKATKGKLGDFTSIVVAYLDRSGRIFVHHDFTKRVPPTRYIAELFNLHEKFKFEKFAVETNLYRNLLLPNILDERKRREAESKDKKIRIAFYDVEQTENKRERITRLEPKVNHGYIVFNRSLSAEFVNQFVDFPHADHDDAPDCVEIVWNLAHNRYKPAGVSMDAMASV
jgi:predicted phage terminase large subunit-like protein